MAEAEVLDKVPGKAWRVVFAGTAVNLCLGILYAWSIWAGALVFAVNLVARLRRESAAGSPADAS